MFGKIKILFNLFFLPKSILDFKPDVIFFSLEYSLFAIRLRKLFPEAKLIIILHGFPTYNYGLFRIFVINKIIKISSLFADFLISNSKLTHFINNEIYGIKSSTYFHLGLTKQYNKTFKPQSTKINFLFVGRLVKEKKVELVIHLFKLLSMHNQNLSLTIVGDGPEYKTLKKKHSSNNIKFLGRLDSTNLNSLYTNSHYFISLNSHEPFGLVFLEALSYGCKIICPTTGGQSEFLVNNDFVLFIDTTKIDTQVNKVLEFLDYSPTTSLESFFTTFNMKNYCINILNFIYKKQYD